MCAVIYKLSLRTLMFNIALILIVDSLIRIHTYIHTHTYIYILYLLFCQHVLLYKALQ